jgi:N-acetylglutamate synthase-like GNAT family acetyltransferase
MAIRIVPFRNSHQSRVDALITAIKAEFSQPITSAASVQMKQVAHVMGNQFWVAMDGDHLVGTIGIVRVKYKNACLKSMFVANEYRGKGVANLLLNTLLVYSKKKSVEQIYLGTMHQMKAAQVFYEKNGFVQINSRSLPTDFGMNPLDDVFYRLEVI